MDARSVKKRGLAESFREPHFDGNGRAKKPFGSYWEADRYIDSRHLAGQKSYWCRVCQSVHVGQPPQDANDALKMMLFEFDPKRR
jgi:hypothetical protein